MKETMDVIDILMPTEEGRFIPQEVIEGIIAQNIPFRLWVSTKFSNGNYSGARNNVKQYGNSDFALMLDNDIVLPPNALIAMLQFLKNNPLYGAIGVPTYYLLDVEQEECLHAYHVGMSCVLFRREVLDKIRFFHPGKDGTDHPSGGRCECAVCCWDIRKMGLEIGYITGFKADHIANTRLGYYGNKNHKES